MKKTYAYNSVIIGVLLGLLAYISSGSLALGVVVVICVSVAGYFIIRQIEKAVYKGADKAADKISEAYQQRKEQKAAADAGPTVFCTHCGAEIPARAKFCPSCGSSTAE